MTTAEARYVIAHWESCDQGTREYAVTILKNAGEWPA